MAADSFHKNVEEAMHVEKKLYNFDDFTKYVNTHGTAIEMDLLDFKLFVSQLSKGKDTYYPHISNIRVDKNVLEGETYGHRIQKKFRKFIE